jgi:hypothetical protein
LVIGCCASKKIAACSEIAQARQAVWFQTSLSLAVSFPATFGKLTHTGGPRNANPLKSHVESIGIDIRTYVNGLLMLHNCEDFHITNAVPQYLSISNSCLSRSTVAPLVVANGYQAAYDTASASAAGDSRPLFALQLRHIAGSVDTLFPTDKTYLQ